MVEKYCNRHLYSCVPAICCSGASVQRGIARSYEIFVDHVSDKMSFMVVDIPPVDMSLHPWTMQILSFAFRLQVLECSTVAACGA